MKRIISFVIIFFTVLCSYAQPVKIHGQLKVQGTQLLDKNNNQIALHGVSFGWSCYHPRVYTAGIVKTLATKWNCNVVRAALGVEPENGYIKDSAKSMKLITTVVDAAIKENIYVIIDWHSHNINLKEAKIFFKNMATKYHQYPNVIYELYNEPDYETWAEVKAYSEELIKVIRAIDKQNIILVGSPHWDQDVNLPAADPIKNEINLMYTMHFYAGTHKQELRDKTDSAIATGLPIFVSESAGMEATGGGGINYAEWQKWITWIDERKLSWITWSISDKDETCSMLNPSANSNGKWKDKDIKESGLKVKGMLNHYLSLKK
jgi:endoglucanase